MDNAKTNTVSQAGYKKLQEEKEYLVTVRRSEVAQKLKDARSFVDHSENAVFDEAMYEQAIIVGRIKELELILASATIVSDDDITTHEVSVGSIIKLKDLELDEIETLTIVGSTESDPDNGMISNESPIGRACMRKKVGDVIEVEAPVGILKFEIMEITK